MSRPRAALLLVLVAPPALASCSPGVGREPILGPAEPSSIETPASATGPGSVRGPSPGGAPATATGAADGGGIVVGGPNTGPDAGVSGPSDAPSVFSGIFAIEGAADPLLAREIRGHLSLVVGGWPYVYEGTITASGALDTRSVILTRSGCPQARITGRFDRSRASFTALHRTCDSALRTLSSTITGGFTGGFDPATSGVYELTATIIDPPPACYQGPARATVHYGFSMLPSGVISVFTGDDVIRIPGWYRGHAVWDVGLGTGNFAALADYDANMTIHIGMRGNWAEPTSLTPIQFAGSRDVYDPATDCAFSINLQGVRISVP